MSLHSSIQGAYIRETQKIDERTWPASDQLDKLRTLATTPDPLFIYVATLCRFLETNSENPTDPLELWLKHEDILLLNDDLK